MIGARLAPHVLHDGSLSPYTPLAALVGAIIGAFASAVGRRSMAGSSARGGLSSSRRCGSLDSVGGLVAGAALGLALVWVAGAVALQIPGQPKIRAGGAAVEDRPAGERDRTAAHGVCARSAASTRSRRSPGRRRRAPATTRACSVRRGPRGATERRADHRAPPAGFGVEGSGWVARPHLVVTAAHVVAGGSRHPRQRPRGDGARRRPHARRRRAPRPRPARAAAADRRRPRRRLRRDPRLPGERPVRRPAGPRRRDRLRARSTATLREVTALSGLVRHGNSGGPVVDASGEVEATIFAARIGARPATACPRRRSAPTWPRHAGRSRPAAC